MNIKEIQGEVRENIILMFGIDKLPPEKQEETINRIGKTIFESVLLRVLPTMKEEELAEYEKMLENNVHPDELMEFFFDRVPNFMQIIIEESENFRKDAEEVLKGLK